MSSLADRLCVTLGVISEEPYFKRRMAEDATTREYIDGEILTEVRLNEEFPSCTIMWDVDEDLRRSILAVAVTENGETVGGLIKNGTVTITEGPTHGCFTDRQG